MCVCVCVCVCVSVCVRVCVRVHHGHRASFFSTIDRVVECVCRSFFVCLFQNSFIKNKVFVCPLRGMGWGVALVSAARRNAKRNQPKELVTKRLKRKTKEKQHIFPLDSINNIHRRPESNDVGRPRLPLAVRTADLHSFAYTGWRVAERVQLVPFFARPSFVCLFFCTVCLCVCVI